MKASSLQLTDEEFEDYTSGKRIPTSFKNSISTYVFVFIFLIIKKKIFFKVMRSIGNSIKRIDNLLLKQKDLVNKVEKIVKKIERFVNLKIILFDYPRNFRFFRKDILSHFFK
jgi:hypothetical protein